MAKAIYTVIGLVVIIGSLFIFFSKPASERFQPQSNTPGGHSEGEIIQIGETRIPVEVVDTDEERQMGLSGRESLKWGTGMWFVFSTPGVYGIWMKDMKFPIDIMWVGPDLRIVHIEKDVSPDTYPDQVFTPPLPAKYVLEVPAGFLNASSIDMNSHVFLKSQN